MDTLNDHIRAYTALLAQGHIQKAYRGIIGFMTELKAFLERRHTDYTAGALYMGYMDMTYFAFTPAALKLKKLKIAIVYLHEEARIELWLAAGNRKIQADYIALLSQKDIGGFTLSQPRPGVDSIIAFTAAEQIDFDRTDALMTHIETQTIQFAGEMLALLA